jgi:hypothetical protein
MKYLHLDHSFTIDGTATVTLTEGGQICDVRVTVVDKRGEPVELKLDFVDVKSEMAYLQDRVDETLDQ